MYHSKIFDRYFLFIIVSGRIPQANKPVCLLIQRLILLGIADDQVGEPVLNEHLSLIWVRREALSQLEESVAALEFYEEENRDFVGLGVLEGKLESRARNMACAGVSEQVDEGARLVVVGFLGGQFDAPEQRG